MIVVLLSGAPLAPTLRLQMTTAAMAIRPHYERATSADRNSSSSLFPLHRRDGGTCVRASAATDADTYAEVQYDAEDVERLLKRASGDLAL